MRKKFCWMLIAGFLVFSALAWGQDKDKDATQKPAEEPSVIKIIPIKYADPERVRSLLIPFGGNIRVDDTMRVLTVSGRPATVEAVEEAVKKLDVPPPLAKDVEITAYFLQATRYASTATELPPELKDVVAELKNVLNYQFFTLLNTAIIRAQDDEGASVKGSAGPVTSPADFSLGFQRLNITNEDKGPAVHIRNLEFTIIHREPEPKSETKSSDEAKESSSHTNLAAIRTNIDVPVGEKVVVGKTTFIDSGNALVLVLTAKVMN